MSYQYIFPFAVKDDLGEFIITDIHKLIIDFFKQWPNWGSFPFANILYIAGPARSGKTHLLLEWQYIFRAEYISLDYDLDHIKNINMLYLEDLNLNDDLEKQKKLLHLINFVNETNKYLIITSRVSPTEQLLSIADLRSRINSVNYMAINECDDILFSILLYKHLAKYNLRPNKDVIKYIEQKLKHSYEIIEKFAETLNNISLKEMKKPTIQLIKKIIEEL